MKLEGLGMTWRALGAICSSFHVGTDLRSPSLGLKLFECAEDVELSGF